MRIQDNDCKALGTLLRAQWVPDKRQLFMLHNYCILSPQLDCELFKGTTTSDFPLALLSGLLEVSREHSLTV